ncbi:hypothetical protein LIER_12959 [Lithospermum erythrorhizon]|uniref:Uncharacterized protein n=1 Tax=Lithospermum erythrorhizon TaxID=34254 RepID=A0AAV3PTW9_LITER
MKRACRCKIIAAILIFMVASEIAFSRELPLSPLASPASTIFHSAEPQKIKQVQSHISPRNIDNDYGNWDPTPYFGGDVGGLIPHR